MLRKRLRSQQICYRVSGGPSSTLSTEQICCVLYGCVVCSMLRVLWWPEVESCTLRSHRIRRCPKNLLGCEVAGTSVDRHNKTCCVTISCVLCCVRVLKRRDWQPRRDVNGGSRKVEAVSTSCRRRILAMVKTAGPRLERNGKCCCCTTFGVKAASTSS